MAANQIVDDQVSCARIDSAKFLNRLAHELRTPLGSILMLSELLVDNPHGRLSSKEVEYAYKIGRAGAEVRDLLQQVIVLVKLDAGLIVSRPSEVTISDLAAELHQDFAGPASDSGLELIVELADDLPLTLKTDRGLLVEAFDNLLRHAFRSTVGGTVELRFERASAAPIRYGDEAVAACVAGRGWANDPALFEPFASVTNERGAERLELPVARALARGLGGDLRFEPASENHRLVFYLPIC